MAARTRRSVPSREMGLSPSAEESGKRNFLITGWYFGFQKVEHQCSFRGSGIKFNAGVDVFSVLAE